jgi:hypothetical protein
MPFDESAPRMMLPAIQVRAGDYVRRDARSPWQYVILVQGNAHGVTLSFEGGDAVNFAAQRTLEVSRRTRWVEVDDRFRVIDTFPYLEREDEYSDLTLDEAAARAEDLTGHPADDIIATLGEEGVTRWDWEDGETGREVALQPEVERDPPRELPGGGS